MLDVECSVRGFPETYVQKLKVQHKENGKLFEPNHCDASRTFGIHHYAGQVVYDTTEFLGGVRVRLQQVLQQQQQRQQRQPQQLLATATVAAIASRCSIS